ncbi:hypothetical protein KUV89_02050 [Marinobacter hydrocarbonoclasticus]|nr:hypothetical protein [Marinobacter nauticus]
MKSLSLATLALTATTLAAEPITDLSAHSRETHTPLGQLSKQSAQLQTALAPFAERCREAGEQLYQRHQLDFPYGPEGEPTLPSAQAWYLPGTWHNEANPNIGITMSVELHTAALPTLSVGHLVVAGRDALANAMAQRNKAYIAARGGPALRCDILIQGLIGTGEQAEDGPVASLMAALNPTYRVNRQRIRLLIDNEVVITDHEVYGQLHRAVSDQNADMVHQKQAASISKLAVPGATTEVETAWRVHGKRQPGAYLRVKHEDQLLYRCDLQVDGDQLHAQCGLAPEAEIWAFNQLGDEAALASAAEESVARLKANREPDIKQL